MKKLTFLMILSLVPLLGYSIEVHERGYLYSSEEHEMVNRALDEIEYLDAKVEWLTEERNRLLGEIRKAEKIIDEALDTLSTSSKVIHLLGYTSLALLIAAIIGWML